MKITILVDNYVTKRRFITEHGFSMLIENKEDRILFDTGQGFALMHNIEVQNIDSKSIRKVVLSHGHDDHTGGLESFNNKNSDFKLFAHPDIIYPKFKVTDGIKRNIGIKMDLKKLDIKFSSKPIEISRDIIFSGEIPKINRWELEETAYYREKAGGFERDPFSDDISLYVKLDKGLLVLTGCAHSGIINIIEYGMKITGERKLYGIIGGMHLKNASAKRIEKTVG
ncbi:MAG: MBL fold metallo-hydrolase, partial [Nitrospiraceae bacterium]|nr:MBL fold metallo-hydrolase [Nitrospiraceae bacterium]